MSPKVVLQKMEEIPLIYCDSLSYSGGHNVKLYQSKKTCAKPSKSIDSSDIVKSGKVLSSEAVPVAGSSKQVTERPENPPVTVKEVTELFQTLLVSNKLFNHVGIYIYDYRDIKNVTQVLSIMIIQKNYFILLFLH